MNTADLITSFFNNELSPDQERQFLLSVASSDSLRLGLKSHVMLDKILHEELTRSRVPSNIRVNVMKEAAIIAAASSTFNGGEAVAKDTSSSTEVVASEEGSPSTFWGRIPRWVSGPMIMLLSVGSFLAGYYTGGDESTQADLESGLTTPPIEEVESTLPTSRVPIELTTSQTEVNQMAAESEGQQVVRGTHSPSARTSRESSNVTDAISSTRNAQGQSDVGSGNENELGGARPTRPNRVTTSGMMVEAPVDSSRENSGRKK
ncbi:MAG: hypothetical protein AB7H80_03315 [Candidatus Kapaibacterium sp.]